MFKIILHYDRYDLYRRFDGTIRYKQQCQFLAIYLASAFIRFHQLSSITIMTPCGEYDDGELGPMNIDYLHIYYCSFGGEGIFAPFLFLLWAIFLIYLRKSRQDKSCYAVLCHVLFCYFISYHVISSQWVALRMPTSHPPSQAYVSNSASLIKWPESLF